MRGSGFPRVIAHPVVPAIDTELPDIRIPPPTPLSLIFKDPSPTENAVRSAFVRIYANVSGRDHGPVEIGNGTTAADGSVEILLAPEPP